MIALAPPHFVSTVAVDGEDRQLLEVDSRLLTLTGDREGGFGGFELRTRADRREDDGEDGARPNRLDHLSFERPGRDCVWAWSRYAYGKPQTTRDVGGVFARLGFDPDLAWRIARVERYVARGFDVTSRLRLGFLAGAHTSALAVFTVQRNRTLNLLDAVQTAPCHTSFGVPSDFFVLKWWQTDAGRAWWPEIHARTEGMRADVSGRNILKYHLAGLGFDSGIVDCVFGAPREK